jgi:23S rRNA (adenine2503-C2)-methyltransferase
MPQTPIFGLRLDEIKAELAKLDIPAFRATQIVQWLYNKGVWEVEAMSNLGKELQEKLKQNFILSPAKIKTVASSQDGQTQKFLLEFTDGKLAETVLMRTRYGASVCISSQAGCAMGCKFCASTLRGLERNLTAGEMLAQATYASYILQKENLRLSHIVVMGSGEPLMNYDNLIRFIKLANAEYALGIGLRHITVSTCGIVPAIKKLQAENLPITLAISLHAPYDELRSKLMPINLKYPLNEVLKAANDYANHTKRQVTYEYVLLAGVNDSNEHANQLSDILRGKLASVNLIPFNSVDERTFKKPDFRTIKNFADILEKRGIVATIRRERGSEVNAACGQLRNRVLKDGKNNEA